MKSKELREWYQSGISLYDIEILMMNDLKDLKRVHNLANYLMAKRIKDNAKVAEA